jgi:hypothetical protein
MKDLFDRTEDEILNLIKEQSEIGDDLIVVGRFVNYKGKESFINIRNKNFVPLTYVGQGNEHIGQRLKIEIREKHSYTLEKEWYEFKIKLGDERLRRFLNNPTLPTIDLSFEPKIYHPKEKEFVLNLYKRKSNQDLEADRGNIQSLKIIEREINRVEEAFIYELLQNADDYPLLDKKVDVKIFTKNNRFVFSHNGSPFKFNNVYALCNINDGDKQDDADKIGYKGIGFKSVFAYSDKVFVKSGQYTFKFDKNSPEFQREKPFQIIPIWVDNLGEQKGLPITENVNIIIEAKQGKIQINEWEKLLNEIFLQESSIPVILFLRNIRNVFINRTLVSKTTKEWWIRDYKLKLSDEIKLDIKRQFETNTGNIPEKLVGVEEIEIQFSLKHLDYEIIPLSEAILYNYLPTKVNLGLPFLVNSDFIPTGDRHYLFENEWNRYLMKEVGKVYFQWLNTLFTVKHKNTDQPIFKRDYLRLLPDISKNIQELKSKSSNNLFLLEAFKDGFDLALIGNGDIEPIAFIPTISGFLVTLSNILIDETGLAELLGDEFSQLTGISENLIDDKVGQGIEKIKDLIKQNEIGVIYDASRLKDDIQAKLQDWLKNPSNNFKFIEHLNSHDSLKGLLKSEEIILSNNGELCQASNLFAEVPDEIIFLFPKKVNNEVLNFIKDKNFRFDFKKFEPVQFLSESIVGKEVVLYNETNLLHFWQFVFNNWEELENDKAIVNCLKSIEILCKSSNPDLLLKCVISKSYLSAEFNISNEIESTVKSIIEGPHFISEKYILKSGDEIKWCKIFNRLGVIGDLQKTVDDLLPKLSSINEQQHFIITKQIFKFWKENKDKETRLTKDQIDLIENNLKLKSIDNIYLETSKCIISDYYQTNKIIDSTLPEVCLINQISSEYSNTQILEWNTFFKEIGCISLDDKQQVLDAKLSFIILKQDDFQEIHFEYIKGIYNLYNSRNTNGLDFDFVNILSQVKLKTTDNEFRSPFDIHLSSIYKPKIDIQSDVDFNESFINYLNKKYFEFKIDKYFLIKIGVNEAFRFHKKDLKRDEIPSEYKTEFENRFNYIVQNAPGYGSQHRLLEHIDLNYKNLLTTYKYSLKFWDEVTKPTPNFVKYLFQKSTYKTAFNSFEFENYILNFLKKNPTLPNQSDELNLPSQMYSFILSEYISDKSVLPKYDFSNLFYNDDKTDSLESILGIKSKLSPKFCVELFSRKENHLSIDEISNLRIVDILLEYKPTVDEIESIYLPNVNQIWKPVSQLFISNDDQLQLESSQKLHEHLISLAETFGVKELSEDNLILKVSPEEPEFSDDVIFYFKEKAKFIAFKIDQLNWEEIETNIVEHLSSFKFSEVDFIAKVFPRDEPIYEQILDFYFDKDRNEIFYNGLWKNNKRVIEFLRNQIQSEKIENVWFDNIINRWNDRKIIETLIDMFGFVPDTWVSDSEEDETESQKDDDYIDPFWSALTDSDIEFIREIIGGEYELDEQMDSNLAAKIKTLMIIRSDYSQAEISDEGYFLRAGLDEIIVRSAQRGLLFLDLYHWKRLGEKNVKLAIHTNNQITFFRTQQDLFDFAKPMNKYGIMKLPISYSLADFNSIGKVSKNGKWHFVIIVNENTKTAESYKNVMNLDEYNF